VVRKRSELENKIKIFASEKNWIEGEALRQLEKIAEHWISWHTRDWCDKKFQL